MRRIVNFCLFAFLLPLNGFAQVESQSGASRGESENFKNRREEVARSKALLGRLADISREQAGATKERREALMIETKGIYDKEEQLLVRSRALSVLGLFGKMSDGYVEELKRSLRTPDREWMRRQKERHYHPKLDPESGYRTAVATALIGIQGLRATLKEYDSLDHVGRNSVTDAIAGIIIDFAEREESRRLYGANSQRRVGIDLAPEEHELAVDHLLTAIKEADARNETQVTWIHAFAAGSMAGLFDARLKNRLLLEISRLPLNQPENVGALDYAKAALAQPPIQGGADPGIVP